MFNINHIAISVTDIERSIECYKKQLSDFDICFCSPLKRTKQTAEILVSYLNKIYDERIIEKGLFRNGSS